MTAASALGVIGGYWRWRTGSIIPAMVTHTMANLLRWRQMAETVRRGRLQIHAETTAGADGCPARQAETPASTGCL